ncbi:MAG: multicomponent Na+:H+ antiporter subunit D [Gammaproteobacteria bacterium]
MSASVLVVLAVVIPLLGAAVLALLGPLPNRREAVTFVTAGALCAVVVALAGDVFGGERPEVTLFELLPGLSLTLSVEPLGMLFGLVASTLWIVNSVYSVGYMRANHEPRQTQFYVCFAVALASTMGVAFAGNLFTLFIFYEILTLTTYPLVAHHGDEEAKAGARRYLTILLGTSIALFLPAIIWTYVTAGTLDFRPGGILAGNAGATETALLLALFAFGIGKAALMPFHKWLPSAMVAPTPVSALLHAVAVVKAGVFTVLKVVVYIFGPEHLLATGASQWLVYLASFTLLASSVIALTRTNLKARLAYSTVSQLSYVILGAALATPLALVGAAMHIVMHAAGKITLFFCAGAIYTAHHKTEINQLDGIGKLMPFTMAAFFVGALSVTGLPPLAGTWSKVYLALGGLEAGHLFVVAVLMLSSLLNVAYLMPIVGRAFFPLHPRPREGSSVGSGESPGAGSPQSSSSPAERAEAPWLCVAPLCITATLCVVLFFFADELVAVLSEAFAAPASTSGKGG